MVTGGERPLCPLGCNVVDARPRNNLYTGRQLWVGADAIFGKKKARSDELRADTETEMVRP